VAIPELLPILDVLERGDAARGQYAAYHLTRLSKALGIDQLYAKHQG